MHRYSLDHKRVALVVRLRSNGSVAAMAGQMPIVMHWTREASREGCGERLAALRAEGCDRVE